MIDKANVMGTKLKKSLGLLDATLLVAGSMIGSGIFIVSTIMLRDIGSPAWLLVLWVLTGIITIFAALSYGELAGMMPNAGGQYIYIQRAYGRLTSFLYGWTVFSVIQTGVIAAVAVAFAKYSSIFFPVLNQNLLQTGFLDVSLAQVVAIGSIVFLTAMNTFGLQNGKWVQLVFTFAKIFALVGLIGLGFWFGSRMNFFTLNFKDAWSAFRMVKTGNVFHRENLTGLSLLSALGATLIFSLFSSDAWNNVTFIAGEIKNPKKNIPRSLFLGTLIVTIIYILANVAYLMLLPIQGNPNATNPIAQGIMFASNDRVGTSAAFSMFGNVGIWLMAGLIMISTFGCNNGLILAGSRLYYAMSKDGLFFKKAGQLNKHSVPSNALWIQCLWASLLCLSGKYSDLLTYSTFASLLFYILTISGLFRLRRTEPLTERPYKAFGYPLVPALYIVIATAICINLFICDFRNSGAGLLLVLVGIPFYFFTRARNS
jgi:APA family basic amino acid/polyamine antiporter